MGPCRRTTRTTARPRTPTSFPSVSTSPLVRRRARTPSDAHVCPKNAPRPPDGSLANLPVSVSKAQGSPRPPEAPHAAHAHGHRRAHQEHWNRTRSSARSRARPSGTAHERVTACATWRRGASARASRANPRSAARVAVRICPTRAACRERISARARTPQRRAVEHEREGRGPVGTPHALPRQHVRARHCGQRRQRGARQARVPVAEREPRARGALHVTPPAPPVARPRAAAAAAIHRRDASGRGGRRTPPPVPAAAAFPVGVVVVAATPARAAAVTHGRAAPHSPQAALAAPTDSGDVQTPATARRHVLPIRKCICGETCHCV